MTIKDMMTIIDEKQKAEEEVKRIVTKLTDAANDMNPKMFNDCDYESAKKLFDSVKYYIKDKNRVKELLSIVETKKIKKYPELLKPTYYPEIDTLDISDSEKLRLDKAARWNYRNYISKNNIDRLTHPLTINDLELLKNLGIAQLRYHFKCTECGISCTNLSEEDLEKHKRVWELEKLGSSLTDEQDEELEELYKEGFFRIFLTCLDCDEFEEAINSEEELEAYKNHIEISYKITKQPNLGYEKL